MRIVVEAVKRRAERSIGPRGKERAEGARETNENCAAPRMAFANGMRANKFVKRIMWDRRELGVVQKAKSINSFSNHASRLDGCRMSRRRGVSLAKTRVGRGRLLPINRPARGAIIGKGFCQRRSRSRRVARRRRKCQSTTTFSVEWPMVGFACFATIGNANFMPWIDICSCCSLGF
jgi:hypothetical protein